MSSGSLTVTQYCNDFGQSLIFYRNYHPIFVMSTVFGIAHSKIDNEYSLLDERISYLFLVWFTFNRWNQASSSFGAVTADPWANVRATVNASEAYGASHHSKCVMAGDKLFALNDPSVGIVMISKRSSTLRLTSSLSNH